MLKRLQFYLQDAEQSITGITSIVCLIFFLHVLCCISSTLHLDKFPNNCHVFLLNQEINCHRRNQFSSITSHKGSDEKQIAVKKLKVLKKNPYSYSTVCVISSLWVGIHHGLKLPDINNILFNYKILCWQYIYYML